MDEKRRFPRLNYNVEVEWKKVDRSKGGTLEANVTKNISEGGICLMVDDSVRPQDMLELKIMLPTQATISVKGAVRWVESFGIAGEKSQPRHEAGIEFVEIDDQDREKMKKFTKYLEEHMKVL